MGGEHAACRLTPPSPAGNHPRMGGEHLVRPAGAGLLIRLSAALCGINGEAGYQPIVRQLPRRRRPRGLDLEPVDHDGGLDCNIPLPTISTNPLLPLVATAQGYHRRVMEPLVGLLYYRQMVNPCASSFPTLSLREWLKQLDSAVQKLRGGAEYPDEQHLWLDRVVGACRLDSEWSRAARHTPPHVSEQELKALGKALRSGDLVGEAAKLALRPVVRGAVAQANRDMELGLTDEEIDMLADVFTGWCVTAAFG